MPILVRLNKLTYYLVIIRVLWCNTTWEHTGKKVLASTFIPLHYNTKIRRRRTLHIEAGM